MKKDELVLNSAVIGSKFDLEESNTIVFSIAGEAKIKINEEGFFIGDELIEKDKEIYNEFKEWIDLALKEVKRSQIDESYPYKILPEEKESTLTNSINFYLKESKYKITDEIKHIIDKTVENENMLVAGLPVHRYNQHTYSTKQLKYDIWKRISKDEEYIIYSICYDDDNELCVRGNFIDDYVKY